ncbi:MAG: flagellar biosynthesis anti-sigma factor FlgM [Anaerolineales bacterium]|nr:flagellar biosynthesis anti-sigma factor FlgM [Anaerolineales bacterium]
MNEFDDRRLDELLVEFTDRILPLDALDQVDLSAPGSELRSLEDTVALLKRAIADDEPYQVVSERIRARLTAEWHRSGILESQPLARKQADRRRHPSSWFRRIPGLRMQRSFAMGFAALAVLLLFALLLFSPEIEGGNLTATVTARTGLLPAILLAAFAVLVVAYWFYRKRR